MQQLDPIDNWGRYHLNLQKREDSKKESINSRAFHLLLIMVRERKQLKTTGTNLTNHRSNRLSLNLLMVRRKKMRRGICL